MRIYFEQKLLGLGPKNGTALAYRDLAKGPAGLESSEGNMNSKRLAEIGT